MNVKDHTIVSDLLNHSKNLQRKKWKRSEWRGKGWRTLWQTFLQNETFYRNIIMSWTLKFVEWAHCESPYFMSCGSDRCKNCHHTSVHKRRTEIAMASRHFLNLKTKEVVVLFSHRHNHVGAVNLCICIDYYVPEYVQVAVHQVILQPPVNAVITILWVLWHYNTGLCKELVGAIQSFHFSWVEYMRRLDSMSALFGGTREVL